VDIGKLMQAIKAIPKDKMKSDSGLKEVLRELAKKNGKRVSDQDLDRYVSQFRKMQRTESVGSLLDKLSKKGVKASDLHSLKRRLKK